MNTIEELYNLYFAKIYSYVLMLSHDEHIAEEITQQTFFKSIRSIKSFQGECEISTWLCTIAKNLYFDYIKKQKRHTEIEHDLSDPSNMEVCLCDKEQAFLIHQVLHGIEEPYREVFTLRIFGELSFSQIGKIFNKTDNWARVTYYRAKTKIQERMEEFHG